MRLRYRLIIVLLPVLAGLIFVNVFGPPTIGPWVNVSVFFLVPAALALARGDFSLRGLVSPSRGVERATSPRTYWGLTLGCLLMGGGLVAAGFWFAPRPRQDSLPTGPVKQITGSAGITLTK